jgi:tetratricopeptide (TPR) repeat protein
MAQAFDDLGFPIPAEFDLPDGGGRPNRRGVSGRFKRWAVLGIALGVLVPAVVIPAGVPVARQMVVQWSLERAVAREARDDIAGAVRELGRAVDWHGDDATLLAARAMLRLENRDAAGALADATRAVDLAPVSLEPYRVRSIVHVCLGNPEAALADAALVVELAGGGNAESLNLRAYVRGLVGREIPEALADVEQAMASMPTPPPEFLDTRGFLLHLAGRHEEAFVDLNRAIELTQEQRRQMMLLAGRIERLELLRRLRVLDHSLGVMFQHRGLAAEALGAEEQARDDFELARRKGYDPTRGIL